MPPINAANHPIKRFVGLMILIGLLGATPPAAAQFDGGGFGDFSDDSKQQVAARLTTATDAVVPGQPFTAALVLDIKPKWHVYWINPEGPGKPVKVNWTLPEGYTVSDPIWPAPLSFSFDGMTQFGYEDQLVLMYEITPPKDAAGEVLIQAKADWLACKTTCIPGKASLQTTLPVEASADPTDDAELIQQARAQVPTSAEGWSVSAEKTDAGYTLTLQTPSEEAAQSLKDLYFFSSVEFAVDPSAQQTATVDGKTVRLSLDRRAQKPFNAGPVKFDPPLRGLTGVLTASSGFGEQAQALKIDAPFANADTHVPPTDNTSEGAATDKASTPGAKDDVPLTFLAATGLALLGGLVLNLMPCVFPVLSIKILGFVQSAGEQPVIVRRHGYAFGAGVLISFWVLVAVLLSLRAAATAATGDASSVSWGFQLQNPTFVLAMIVLMFLIGLNLIGTFEVGIGLSSAAGKASQAASDGYSKSFFTGVLATLIATPCTGPFMAPALGAAFAMPVPQAITVFTALGVGMATPYVVLSCFPKLLDYLPKPGPWMESFKQAMSFPMFATAGAGVWIYAGLTDDFMVLVLLIALSVIAMGAWVYGRWATPMRSDKVRWIARIAALVLVVGGILASGSIAHQIESARIAIQEKKAAGEYVAEWVDYSPEKIESLRTQGRPVLVDFTARWCAICQTNKFTSLRTGSAEQLYKRYDVALVEADYTREDPMIGKTLEKYERAGVPLYLVFPADGGEPEVLPNTLTPQIVEAAIKRAADKSASDATAVSNR